MLRDPFEVLGIARDADEDTIKRAYRKRSAKYHPDNQQTGDAGRFMELNRAYEVLTKPPVTMPPPTSVSVNGARSSGPPSPTGRPSAPPSPSGRPNASPSNPPPTNGARSNGVGQNGASNGAASNGAASNGAGYARSNGQRLSVSIDFASAIRGTSVTLTVGGGNVGVRIPPGALDGSNLIVTSDRWAGELTLEIHVEPHPFFRRDGDDLHVEVPLSIGEAYRGALVRVPTPAGEVALRVPPLTQSGQTTCVQGRGVPRNDKAPGDLYVKFLVAYPKSNDADVARAVEVLDKKMADPRANLRF